MTKQQEFLRKLAHLLYEYDAEIWVSTNLSGDRFMGVVTGDTVIYIEGEELDSKTLFKEIQNERIDRD